MHRFLGDAVAVKLLRSGLAQDEAAVTAFLAEAERTRAIDHPAVVRVIDFGREEDTGQCYLVMERVDGETLSARIARGALAEAEVRRIGAAIAGGMQAAHDRGIVHRDLKPANIVLRDGAPVIVDFGIAKALGEEGAAQTSRRVGTPPYMAPEQLVSGLITPGVDIWALGAVLFEAATGRRPFTGHDEGRCPQLIETAPRARTLVPISTALDDLLARCLEREPGRRPTSMSSIASVLLGEAPPFAESSERRTEDLGQIAPSAAPGALAAPEERRPGDRGTITAPEPPTTVDPTPLFASSSRRRWFLIGGIAAAALLATLALVAASSRDRNAPTSAESDDTRRTQPSAVNGETSTANSPRPSPETRAPSSGTRAPSSDTRAPSSDTRTPSPATATVPETETETETVPETETETVSKTVPETARPAKKSGRRTGTHRPAKPSATPPDTRDPRAGREGLD